MIPEFDKFLATKGLTFEAVVIGGSALALLGIITRETRDCDILSPNIPDDIIDAAADFANAMSAAGFELRKDWLNNGSSSLLKNLPQDWSSRIQIIFTGKNLKLFTLGRPDGSCVETTGF